MADVLFSPVVVLSFVTGALVIVLYYISHFVKSVAKESERAIPEPELKKNPSKSSAGKQKKNVERRVREGKTSYSHPWLLSSLKGHTGAILDMDLSPNGKYLATTAEVPPKDPGGGNHPEQKKREDLEMSLRRYLLTPQQLLNLGFPVESKIYPGRAVILRSFPSRASRCDSGSSGSEEIFDEKIDSGSDNEDDAALTEHSCVRCSRGFFLLRDKYLTREKCVYHWGRLEGHRGYSCCRGDANAKGCVSAKWHVWSGMEMGVNGPLDGFVITKPSNRRGIYAVDCEMCYTTVGLELCKVSIVDIDGRIVYDQFVKPQHPVVDYNTRFSGVSAKDLRKNFKTFKEVQKDILAFVSADTILIGHGLENDLKALKIIHSTVVDTAVAFPHPHGLPFRRSLKALVNDLLQRKIQTSTHNSGEDARACLDLMLFRVACDNRSSMYINNTHPIVYRSVV